MHQNGTSKHTRIGQKVQFNIALNRTLSRSESEFPSIAVIYPWTERMFFIEKLRHVPTSVEQVRCLSVWTKHQENKHCNEKELGIKKIKDDCQSK